MRGVFYPSLAWTGIVKNRRFYLPYLFTCVGMVMMFYIVEFLCGSTVIGAIAGGEQMQLILSFGRWVIAVFSVIFLFYTHSFLMRRRKSEFGLYNILGMEKKNIARILFWENLFNGSLSLLIGLVLGVALSKLAELYVIRLLDGEATFALHPDGEALGTTALLFGGLFLFLLADSVRQVYRAGSLSLLHSDRPGEKPPKANWLFALLGVALLVTAYVIAVRIEDPLMALFAFLVAVILVIIATYLLLISGSVALCRLLQKNPRYYYKTNHFISVSQMSYRMKRNGAGLASICILCTMVLVMLSSTTCLYIGAEDAFRNRYPRNIGVTLQADGTVSVSDEQKQEVRGLVAELLAKHGLEAEGLQDYTRSEFAGYVDENGVAVDMEYLNELSMDSASGVWQFFVLSLDDYNRLMGTELSAEEGEAYVYATKKKFPLSELRLGDGEPIRIKDTVKEFIHTDVDTMQVISSLYIFVPDPEKTLEPFSGLTYDTGSETETPVVTTHWCYGFDLDCGDEKELAFGEELNEELRDAGIRWSEAEGLEEPAQIDLELAAKARSSFYNLYGGLFFLGILLGLVFSVATVLMIYYKQLSEGYEDQQRFDILQKVGMTHREIRRSINSQMLTVFFVPALLAGLHLAFAFPLIRKMLLMFGLTNGQLLILTTLGCYTVFVLLYMFVYRVTSRAYYQIVAR
ncbi:MAG: ABC transporter permease [Lachnospiraceae bacterium]|nr:ABC transporter permease [Lachnospiraceae bacterium]